VFRLYHRESGQTVPVGQARRGELRTYTVGPAAGEPVQLGHLRCYLLADLVRRVAERHRLQVTAWQNVPGRPASGRAGGAGDENTTRAADGAGQSLRASCDALNIYPAEFSAGAPEPPYLVIGPADGACGTGASRESHRVSVADALFSDGGATSGPAEVGIADLMAHGIDPLALRHAFLQGHYRQPMTLTWDTIAAADESLRWWRKRVADWARSPSRPMNAAHVAQITAAFDDDLGTPAALGSLQALAEDDAIAPGAKFETFAYLDRLLGLDLAQEVGR
jgi:cysteinyl-tRNA synthetase